MEEWLRYSVCFWHTFRGQGKLFSLYLLSFKGEVLVLYIYLTLYIV